MEPRSSPRGQASPSTEGTALNTPLSGRVRSRTLKVLAAGLAFSLLTPAGVASASSSHGPDITSKAFLHKAESAKRHHKHLTQPMRAALAVHWAYQHLGNRYRLGANGPRVWDCSAFVGAAWRSAGVRLPRTTYDIMSHGYRHVSRSHLQPGDVLEFYGDSHVGIYVGRGYMIHESASRARAIKVPMTYFWGDMDAALRPGF
jgi:cell wall-associated NlpC family hydrolase